MRNKALNGQDLGTVMWYSTKDNNGIILDNDGNEYYFDSSTWLGALVPIRGQLVKFTSGRLAPDGLLVGKAVSDLLG